MTENLNSQKERIEEILNDLKRKVKDISTRVKKISETKEMLDELQYNISKLNDLIELEREIKRYPNNANGSIVLYNKLNEHYESFSETHFNKIVRFVNLIEVEEENYRKSYLFLIQRYSKLLDAKSLKVAVINSMELLNRFYLLLDILITEVNGDKVKYSKVFNFLEDQGFFMTRIEKQSIELLQRINSNLDNVFHGIIHLIESQKEMIKVQREANSLLENFSSEVSSGFGEVVGSLYGIEQELWHFSLTMDKEE